MSVVTLLESRAFTVNGQKAWRVSLWQVQRESRIKYRVRLVNEANGWSMQTQAEPYLQPNINRFEQLCRLCSEVTDA